MGLGSHRDREVIVAFSWPLEIGCWRKIGHGGCCGQRRRTLSRRGRWKISRLQLLVSRLLLFPTGILYRLMFVAVLVHFLLIVLSDPTKRRVYDREILPQIQDYNFIGRLVLVEESAVLLFDNFLLA
ncbi:hypothetical protein KSP40_PGU018659 [Platanthera guangdongensis]|uniref:Uncharacterized protein n=1 Tax=Platanthera guangdongensis TaxID=2320717 RepID=A0ABR2M1Z3_9ASPA